jgi:hypothetical protein
MPGLHKLCPVLTDQALYLVQVAGAEPVVPGEQHRLQPELGLISAGLDMDVGRFLIFVAEKEEAVGDQSASRSAWKDYTRTRLCSAAQR